MLLSRLPGVDVIECSGLLVGGVLFDASTVHCPAFVWDTCRAIVLNAP